LKAENILTAVKNSQMKGLMFRDASVPCADSFAGMVSEPEVIKVVKRLIIPLSESDAFTAGARKAGWKVDFFQPEPDSIDRCGKAE